MYLYDKYQTMIFHIDLDAFFAAIEQRDNPALVGKPIIVGKRIVLTASYKARRFGIHAAMPMFKAKRLCPQVIEVPSNPSKYKKASQQFFNIISSFTPYIEKMSIDEAYLSFDGFDLYYPDLEHIAKTIRKKVQQVIGITCTIGASNYKQVAKIASNHAKPDGLLMIESGQEQSFLAPLPIEDIPGVGNVAAKKLRSLGITTIKKLSKLPYKDMQTLFGKHGKYLYRISHGQGTCKLTLDWEQKSIGRETTFSENTNNHEFVYATLLYLSHKVAFSLRKKSKKASCITIKVRTHRFETKTHQTTIPIPTSEGKLIYKIGKQLLNKTWNQTTQLRLIGISTSGFEQNRQQLMLFQNKNKKMEKIEHALDAIRRKHGFFGTYPSSLMQLKK